MVQRLAARTRGLNRNRQNFFDFGLPNEFRQPLRPQLQFKRRIILHRRRRDDPLAVLRKLGNISERGHWRDISMSLVLVSAEVIRFDVTSMAEVEKMSEAERRRRFRLCPVKCEMDRHVVRSLSDYFSVISGFVIGDAMYWFRGHEQPQWGLTPRALRPTKLADRRRALDLIADFKRVAEAKLP